MTVEHPITDSAEGVTFALDQDIATLTLNRPQRYNTMTMEVISELGAHLESIAARDDIKVVIIASTGKAFSTGHDLKDMNRNRDESYYQALFSKCATVLQSIVNLPQPVIAQVQGIATAAGCQLVATCDLAIAAKSARFATSGIQNGIFCTTPAVALSRTVSRKHALALLMTGDFIPAERAAEIGLINLAVEDDELEAETQAWARRIADKSRFAMRLGKASFYRQLNQPLDVAYEGASQDIICNLLSDDGQEGLTAFMEKRHPQWK